MPEGFRGFSPWLVDCKAGEAWWKDTAEEMAKRREKSQKGEAGDKNLPFQVMLPVT